ncbi:MAG TPA: molybdate ABC transporter permease subunit [Polyangiaceae bacterium]|nr:molybdate ABC transporter permease subunit [Polyangiaceae bacterium]
MLSGSDLVAVSLTLQLASLTTLLLLGIATPLAWWLSTSRSRWKTWVGALVSLPLVLPPAVLGFYLLLWLGPEGPVGRMTTRLGLGALPFTFAGLVVASTVYSLPFVVQPLRNAFEAVGSRPLEVAATLGAGPSDRFFSIAVPLSASGYFTAAVLGFAHTVGEFGVVLMIGGNIPGKTRVLSVALYDHVESLEYGAAHRLAGGLVIFSLLVLFALHSFRAQPRPF